VDDIVRAAHDLAGCSIAPDASLTAEENVELLLRALRLLQLGLEVQVADNDGLLADANRLREDAKVRRGGLAGGGLAGGGRHAASHGARAVPGVPMQALTHRTRLAARAPRGARRSWRSATVRWKRRSASCARCRTPRQRRATSASCSGT
jgi:hypothetical protein